MVANRKLLRFRWKVPIKNLDTNQTIDLFVPASHPPAARMAALRAAYVYLDWKNCEAANTTRVKLAGPILDLQVSV